MGSWRFEALGGLVIAVVLAGCAGTGSPSSISTPSGGSKPSLAASAGAGGANPSGGGQAAQLQKLSTEVSAAQKSTYKAVYSSTGSGGGASTVTIEQAPPESLFSDDGTTVISDGKTTDICSTSGGQAMCYAETGNVNPIAGIETLFDPTTILGAFQTAEASIGAKIAGYSVSSSSETFAGQPSSCVSIGEASQSAKYCVTDAGILAYAGSDEGGSAGASAFQLTSYSTDVPASDFILPAPASPLPSGIGMP